MSCVIAGIDGGATYTRVALYSETGDELGVGQSGPSNPRAGDMGASVQSILEAFRDAWRSAGRTLRAADAAFAGIAGAGSCGELLQAELANSRIADPDHLLVSHDLAIALAGGLRGRPGIAVIAGTGSSCFGKNALDQTAIAGHRGPFLDDSGSAFDLGRRGLMAAARAQDGRGPDTVLIESLSAFDEKADWAHSKKEVAALAVHVTAASAEGDAVARSLISDAVDDLSRCVEAVARRLDMQDPEVACCGGLARSGPAYRVPLEAALRARLPACRPCDPELPPLVGAAVLAARSLGIEKTFAPR